MDSFQIDEQSERAYAIRLEEVVDVSADLVQTLIEIDLQTFAESTFSPYTAAAFLKAGRVFLLRANDQIIGTCVCLRSWDRTNEATILSMGLRPGWRGQGLGQHFVQSVLDRLQERGIRSCCLLVGRENRRALKLYEEVGFEHVGESEVDAQNQDVLLLLRIQLSDASQDGAVIELPQGS
ncbi:MAG: GNAT family N-acetyltransferase [Myxococcota bacterium]